MGRRVALVSAETLWAEAIELGHVAARMQDGGQHIPALVAEQEASKHIRAAKALAQRLGQKMVVSRAHPSGRRVSLDLPLALGAFAEATRSTLVDLHYEQEREAALLSIN